MSASGCWQACTLNGSDRRKGVPEILTRSCLSLSSGRQLGSFAVSVTLSFMPLQPPLASHKHARSPAPLDIRLTLWTEVRSRFELFLFSPQHSSFSFILFYWILKRRKCIMENCVAFARLWKMMHSYIFTLKHQVRQVNLSEIKLLYTENTFYYTRACTATCIQPSPSR